jgi:NitT/TauT family transport system substrate-binding protein
MNRAHIVSLALALAAPAVAPLPLHADDTLKVAIGQINNWENQAPTLGQEAGIFKKNGLVLETFGTAGAGETLQPIISGSADIGIGVGVAGAMRAFSSGAPVRILAPAFTGSSDLYWYVRADSPIKKLSDATPANTVAYSTNGSSSHNLVLAFVEELGLKAKPTPTGSPPATLTAVMSGQIDIGWAAPPIAMQEIKDGRLRIIVRGSDAPSLRGQTCGLPSSMPTCSSNAPTWRRASSRRTGNRSTGCTRIPRRSSSTPRKSTSRSNWSKRPWRNSTRRRSCRPTRWRTCRASCATPSS